MSLSEYDKKVQRMAVEVAISAVLRSDAEGPATSPKHVEAIVTLIQGYLWSNETENIVLNAARKVEGIFNEG